MSLPFKSLSSTQIRSLWWLILALILLPFIGLAVDIYTDELGPNPVDTLTKETGTWALYILCMTLAVTPVRRLTGWNWLIKMRRMLGLTAYFYVCLHFLIFIWFDHAFDIESTWQDVLTRPFIAVGLITLLILTPLALTSWNRMIRLMGGKRWQQLHYLIYIAVPLALLHFWWAKAGKNLLFKPTLFLIIIAALLVARLVYWYGKKVGRFR
jgi:sulfoxide reductase heme-binding subunit YedZ